MREIKFREWDGEQMHYWGFNIEYPRTFEGPPHARGKSSKNMPQMQFTGLHSKNGKEVYENDIIKFPDEVTTAPQEVLNGAREGSPWHLRTRNARGWWGDPKSWDGIEVIGNIYENPELLEANK